MASTFPGVVDVFKTIPSPTTTATNLSDASNDTLSTRLQQHSDSIVSTQSWSLGNQRSFYALDTGTVNSLVVTVPNAPVSYQQGMMVKTLPLNTNTGSSVINVSSLGSVPILNPAGVVLSGGEISANSLLSLVFNGTAFLISGWCAKTFTTSTSAGSVTIECAGYTAVITQVTITGTAMQVNLSHLASGTSITAAFTNNSGVGPRTIMMTATTPSGVAYTSVNAILSGATAFNNLLTGVTVTTGSSMVFSGASLGNSIYLGY